MVTGELLTRGTIWIALSLYLLTEILVAFSQGAGRQKAARWCSTTGALMYVAHVLAAFGHFHNWSHADAYAETARQTAELTGWSSGSGIYVNYLFTLVWLGDIAWWWINPQSRERRAEGIDHTMRGFFLFMIFNGAFVFVRHVTRWYGLIICLALGVCWWRLWKRPAANAPRSTAT